MTSYRKPIHVATCVRADACASTEDCSANGACDAVTGACVCAEGFAGATCALSVLKPLHPRTLYAPPSTLTFTLIFTVTLLQ